MKLASPEEIAAHAAASRRGAIEGGVASSIVAVGTSYWLHRRYPAYRQLPLSLKALGVVIVVAPFISIQAERRGYEYDQSTWTGDHQQILSEKQTAEAERWEKLPTTSKVGEWAARHQYSIILGGWASSLAVAGTIIQRNKFQTTAQKVVQARMWAQGLTIGLLIVAGALTHTRKFEGENHVKVDHSWQEVLEHQEKERVEAERLRQQALPPTRRVAAAEI